MSISIYKNFVRTVKGLVTSEHKQSPSSDHDSELSRLDCDDDNVFRQMKNLAHEYFTGQTITIEALRDLRHSLVELEDACSCGLTASPSSVLASSSEGTLCVSSRRLSPKRTRSCSPEGRMERPIKRCKEEGTTFEVEKGPIFPLEIIGVISQLIDDNRTFKSLLLCNSQYLDFCRSAYLDRIVGFNEGNGARLGSVYAADLEAMTALFIWDLRPRASYATRLHVTCLSTEIPVLASFLTTRIKGNRSFRDIRITVLPRGALDIVPLLKSVAKTGVASFSMHRALYDSGQPSKVISLQTVTYDAQKLLAQSAITELRFVDVDLSPSEMQNLLRFSLASLNINTLELTCCGKHRILAGLQMPSLRDFDISIDYGQGGILSFVCCHPTLNYLAIWGTPGKKVVPLLPSRPRLPNLMGLIGPLGIAEQLLSGGENCPQVHYLSIWSDVDDASEEIDPSKYVEYAQRVSKLAQEVTQLEHLELDVLSKSSSIVWMEPTCQLLREFVFRS